MKTLLVQSDNSMLNRVAGDLIFLILTDESLIALSSRDLPVRNEVNIITGRGYKNRSVFDVKFTVKMGK